MPERFCKVGYLKNSNIYVANRKKKPQNFGLFYWVVMAIQKNSYSTPYLDEREDCCFGISWNIECYLLLGYIGAIIFQYQDIP